MAQKDLEMVQNKLDCFMILIGKRHPSEKAYFEDMRPPVQVQQMTVVSVRPNYYLSGYLSVHAVVRRRPKMASECAIVCFCKRFLLALLARCQWHKKYKLLIWNECCYGPKALTQFLIYFAKLVLASWALGTSLRETFEENADG